MVSLSDMSVTEIVKQRIRAYLADDCILVMEIDRAVKREDVAEYREILRKLWKGPEWEAQLENFLYDKE
jgi:hypothetical protein